MSDFNEYFRVIGDLGLVGLFGFLWLLFRPLRLSSRGYRLASEGTFARGLCGGYLLAILCMMIHAWGATTFTSIRTMETFMVLTGLFLSQWNLLLQEQGAKDDETESSDPELTPATAWVGRR